MVEALASIVPSDITGVAAPNSHGTSAVICTGLGVAPGMGAGTVVTSASDALRVSDAGGSPVLVVDFTEPGDNVALAACAAVITRSGGMTSHAAIMARQLGIPAICQIESRGAEGLISGREVWVDGSSGRVMDRPPIAAASDGAGPTEHRGIRSMTTWAHEHGISAMAVHANADTGEQVRRGIAAGATGIGLCRTEFQMGPDLSAVFGDRSPAGRFESTRLLAEFEELQQSAMAEFLEAAGSIEVHVRLLDAPSHEFDIGIGERNPMMGKRGARFLVENEEFARAQIRALLRAGERYDGHIHLVIPMVSQPSDAVLVRWIEESKAALAGTTPDMFEHVSVALMIETPAAALSIGTFGERIGAYLFGTNDLAQFAYAASRDDVAAPADTEAMYRLIEIAARDIASLGDDVAMSICGAEASAPHGVAHALRLGMASVSVSPVDVAQTQLLVAHYSAVAELASGAT